MHLVDRWMTDAQRRALAARADCYVSLHRSEGFGLTMAEAMALGKPVIATGYSGNLDFMDSSTAYLVGHGLVEVGPGVDIYPADGVWAEPDLDHAAELMRRVVLQPEEAADRGARARAHVLRRFSPEATGALARTRLEQLMRRTVGRTQQPRVARPTRRSRGPWTRLRTTPWPEPLPSTRRTWRSARRCRPCGRTPSTSRN